MHKHIIIEFREAPLENSCKIYTENGINATAIATGSIVFSSLTSLCDLITSSLELRDSNPFQRLPCDIRKKKYERYLNSDYILTPRLVNFVEIYCGEPFEANKMKCSSKCKLFFHFVNSLLISRITSICQRWAIQFESGQLIQSKSLAKYFELMQQHKCPTYFVAFTACHSIEYYFRNGMCVSVRALELWQKSFTKSIIKPFLANQISKLSWMFRIVVTHIQRAF